MSIYFLSRMVDIMAAAELNLPERMDAATAAGLINVDTTDTNSGYQPGASNTFVTCFTLTMMLHYPMIRSLQRIPWIILFLKLPRFQ